METQELRSSDAVEFIEKLDEMTEIIKIALNQRMPHLKGEMYLTNADLEKLLQVGNRTLRNYRDTGMIGYIQLFGKILYRQSDVLKLLEDNYRPAHRNNLYRD